MERRKEFGGRRRQRLRQRQLPESHLDHHVAGLAFLRLSGRRVEERQSVGNTMAKDHPIDLRQDRRQWLKTPATVLGASLLPLPAAAAEHAQTAPPAAQT